MIIATSRTPTAVHECPRCKAVKREREMIGSQLRRGGHITWYCTACATEIMARLRKACGGNARPRWRGRYS